ncbi:protein of unknown function [Thiomonas sp. Bio17B3]|nr:protein of unknown function [Thiomonas sp. Bio17B3]VDY09470.1 protein of unknown function [Thiomonas sp. Sup16B3]VDY11605.1 protein of unknown function [Thiomonas sp. OC7]VDY19181.1 protein of unknown function [Thiomonas sp. CB2]
MFALTAMSGFTRAIFTCSDKRYTTYLHSLIHRKRLHKFLLILPTIHVRHSVASL